MSSEEHFHLSQFPQTLEFSERDVNFEIISSDVSVTTSSGNHEKGSSKVKLKNIVDFSWEVRFYTGQLIAVNPPGKYVAYVLQKSSMLSSPAVRIWNRETDKRALIKGLEGGVQDLAFAHSSDVILGIVDSAASLLVHRIDEDSSGNIVTSIILNVLQNQPDPSNGINVNSYATQRHRIIWCPYIPDPSEANNEDSSKLLVLTHGNKAELWKISEVATQYGPGPHVITQLVDGYLGFTEHTQPIVDAAFSPDGTALATASLDGEVKFFQVYLYNASKPRCLHMWTPHQGRPLSSLFFLDNHKDYNPDFLFWKYAVTGSNDNSELKLWSCESWKCLQTIRFTSGIKDGRVRLKAVLDATGSYLILSDIDRKLLYVLEITPQSEFGDAMFVRCIAEFPVLYPALALCIYDAGVSKLKEDCSFAIDDILNDDCEDEPQQGVEATVIKMFLVQPKSLQECHIAFQSRSKSKNFIINDNISLHQSKEEISIENKELNEEVQENDGENDGENDVINDLNIIHNTTGGSSSNNNTLVQISGGEEGVSLNLMTPEAFSSPGKRESSSDVLAESIDTQLNSVINVINEDTLLLNTEHRDGAFASAGSSPSREVQEILSHRGSSASNVVATTNDFYPNLKSPSISASNEFKLTSSESVVSAIESTVVTTAASTDGWSQIPMMLVDEVRKSESSNMRNSSELQDTIDSRGNIAKNSTKLESMLNSLVVTNQSLTSIIHKQSHDILSLQEELQSQKEQLEKSCANIQQDVSRMEERTLVQQNNLLESLSQFTQKTVANTTRTVLTEAIRDTLVPGMVTALEPLKFQLKTDVANKLTTTDKILHDNIAKLVCNKTVIDLLADTLTKCLESVAQKSFHQVFESIVLPNFEKSLQTLFGQLNETFSSGTKEYMNNVDTQIDKHRKHGDKSRNDVVSQIQSLNESVRISSDHLLSCVKKDISEQMRTHTNSINDNISLIVKEQISQALKAHQTLFEEGLMLRSGSSTPASHLPDTQVQQTQLTQLLKQGKVTAAFQQALSASNLNLVMFVCEHANPKQLFSQTPCIFPQNVLLSLIQQLSADLSHQTELKLSFLTEAIMVLERSNPVTREHLPIVLNELIRGLSSYISTHQNNETARQMRMLLMATNSLLN